MGVYGAISKFNRLLRHQHRPTATSPISKSNSVTQIILSLLEEGRLRRAVSLLFASPFPFSLSLYAHLFHLCSSHSAIIEARKVESHLITYFDPPPTFLLNRAIETYGKCGCLRDARELFDEMPQRDGGSWNAMITAYNQGGCPEEAVLVFVRMNGLGVFASEVTFASVLGSCGALLMLCLSRQIHGLIYKMGFGGNVILGSSLADIYGKCHEISDARRMFDEIRNPNAVSWNVIVRRYLEVGDNEEAISMFFKMFRDVVRPVTFTLSSALVACSGIFAYKEGTQIHGVAFKIGYEEDEVISSSLIDMYVKCRDLDSAWRIFDQPSSKNLVSWTSMITGYALSGRTKEARELFNEMPERNIISWNAMLAGYTRFCQWEDALIFIYLMCNETKDFDDITLNLILNTCAGISNVELGKQVHAYMYRQGLHRHIIVGNALLDVYGKCGCLRSSRIWFYQLGNLRDTVSWNSLMSTYARHQLSEEVMEIFVDMQQETTPNAYTFATLFSACANIFAHKKGKEIHGFMIRNNYDIDVVILGAMLDMYSKCRSLDYAIKVFKMAAPGDVILWNSMIWGCCHHDKVSEAIELFGLMEKQGVEPDYVSFQALLHACICGGCVDLGRQYFDAMSEKYCVMARLEHYECMIELYGRHGFMDELEEFIKILPFVPTVSMLMNVTDACRKYGNPRLGKWAVEQLNHSDPQVPLCFEITDRSGLAKY